MSSIERYGSAAMTLGVWILVGILGFFLLTEHLAHLFGILPWLLLLACPVMHFFMHRRHHHDHGAPDHDTSSSHPGACGSSHEPRPAGDDRPAQPLSYNKGVPS